MRVLATLLMLLLVTGCDTKNSQRTEVVQTESGPVQGLMMDGVNAFLGIPYARPPVGELRWMPPKLPYNWSNVLPATEVPPHCYQSTFGITRGQEDCLYLNVWTPGLRPGKRLPVMVWIHGGGYTVGHSYESTPGQHLAKRGDVVVVSMNYRLGALGFLAHPELSKESSYKGSGNYGMLDQIHALKWIQRNIAMFGGDRNNITIIGESAGGMSVCNLMVSPLSARRFHKAIIQSGPCFTPYPPLDFMERQGLAMEEALGCSDSEDVTLCMRSKGPDDILDAMPPDPGLAFGEESDYWMPTIDGSILKEQPAKSFAEGRFEKVPVINGNNANEGEIIVMFSHEYRFAALDAEDYPARLNYLVRSDDKVPLVLERYPLENYEDPGAALSAAFGDHTFVCQEKFTSDAIARHAPVYSYYFTYPEADFILPEMRELGAFHSAELQFLFNEPMAWFESEFSGEELTLSHNIMDYWSQFALTGNPNGKVDHPWPTYNENRQRLQIDLALGHTDAAESDEICNFWHGLMNQEFIE